MKTHSKRSRFGSARVEVGTVEYGGRKFSNLGSTVDHERGVAAGYPKGTELQTWDGKKIGSCRVTSSWKQRTPGSTFKTEMFSYRCVIDGIPYVGRGQGDGMILFLKRAK